MNKLPLAKRVAVISALVEGCSIRSTVRMTGVAKNTVVKLLATAGTALARYQHEVMRNLPCRLIQCDELWSFCQMKQANIPDERKDEYGIGDVWTWVAIDAETKLVPCWLVGDRDAGFARAFMLDLVSRLANRVQLTTDGHRAYLSAVDSAFAGNIDYAMLVKIYGAPRDGEARYSPAECIGCERHAITGNPNPKHVSTSFAERQNLTVRMRMRRFTRLTNAFSKKIDNLEYAVAIHYFHYNFICKHQTLKTTPAVAAGVADHVWTFEEMVALIDRPVQPIDFAAGSINMADLPNYRREGQNGADGSN
jgi:IS1 family transposase